MQLNYNAYQIREGFWSGNTTEHFSNNWKVLLKVSGLELIVAKGNYLNLLDLSGETIWDSPLYCNTKPESATNSGDRLIIATTTQDYHAWGFLGPVLLIDLKKAEIIKELKGERIHGLKNGEFLVGLEGYDYFHTWLYDLNGNQLQQWNSYGEYVYINNEIIVIEENRQNPDSSWLIKLNREGSVSKIMKLKSSRSSNAIVISKDLLVFENGGDLIIFNGNLNKTIMQKLINYDPSESSKFLSRIFRNERDIKVEILERTSQPIENYRTHIWKFNIQSDGIIT